MNIKISSKLRCYLAIGLIIVITITLLFVFSNTDDAILIQEKDNVRPEGVPEYMTYIEARELTSEEEQLILNGDYEIKYLNLPYMKSYEEIYIVDSEGNVNYIKTFTEEGVGDDFNKIGNVPIQNVENFVRFAISNGILSMEENINGIADDGGDVYLELKLADDWVRVGGANPCTHHWNFEVINRELYITVLREVEYENE